MPKYSVEEVLAIIKALTPEEKNVLKAHLPSVLDLSSNSVSGSSSTQSRSMSIGGNFEVKGKDLSVDFSQKQAGGEIYAASTTVGHQSSPTLQLLARELAALKQEIHNTQNLNSLQKKTVEAPVTVLEEELKKPEPDKNLIDQAVTSLKKGLSGVQSLAEPTMKVAALVAKAWTGL